MIVDSWDFGWHVKKFFSELCGIRDDRKYLRVKKYGDGRRIYRKYIWEMKIEMEIEGKN